MLVICAFCMLNEGRGDVTLLPNPSKVMRHFRHNAYVFLVPASQVVSGYDIKWTF